MKRLMTLLMAAVLAVLVAINSNVQSTLAAVDPYLVDYCNDVITHYPEAKDDPYIIEECGDVFDNTVKIYDDPGFVEYCFSTVERYPEATEDPYFKEECSDAISSVEQCNNFLKDPTSFIDKTFFLVDSYSKLLIPESPEAFPRYCDVLHDYIIPFMSDLSPLDNSEKQSTVSGDFTRGTKGETCPAGTSLVSVSEAQANQQKICYNVLHSWDIARLANGGSMDGSGYGCGIREKDDRGMGNAVCK